MTNTNVITHTLHLNDEVSLKNEFDYKNLCNKTKAFAEELASVMNLADKKRSEYVLSTLENMIFYPNDDALIDKAICDLHNSGIREGRDKIKQLLNNAAVTIRTASF